MNRLFFCHIKLENINNFIQKYKKIYLYGIKLPLIPSTDGGKAMSIKKLLLDELTEHQLKELAESRGIKIDLSSRQEKYYAGWDEKDKLIDIMNDKEKLTIKDIEDYLKINKSR